MEALTNALKKTFKIPYWIEPLTNDQIDYIHELIRYDNVDEVRNLLQNGIRNEKNRSRDRIHLDEHTHTGTYWIKMNLLHIAVHLSALKCVDLLINAPYAWNIDMPDGIQSTPIFLASSFENPAMSIKMAPLSKQIRPYPANFTVIIGDNFLQYISNFLLWPQLALFDQPLRMKPHLERITEKTIYKIVEYLGGAPKRRKIEQYHGINFGILCELLLANAELVNADFTADGRLPYDDVTQIDSSRMWPITPIQRDFIDEHINCNDYPLCMYNQPPKKLMNIWKMHRFGHTSSHPESSKLDQHNLTPPTLREFSRLIIRRQMVRHVEPLNSYLKEYMFPNQTILLRYLSLPKHLMDYMLFPDILINVNPEIGSGPHSPDLQSSYVEGYPTHGRGTLAFNGFIPKSFNTLHP